MVLRIHAKLLAVAALLSFIAALSPGAISLNIPIRGGIQASGWCFGSWLGVDADRGWGFSHAQLTILPASTVPGYGFNILADDFQETDNVTEPRLSHLVDQFGLGMQARTANCEEIELIAVGWPLTLSSCIVSKSISPAPSGMTVIRGTPLAVGSGRFIFPEINPIGYIANTIMLWVVLFGGRALWILLRSTHRRRVGRCVACGYSVDGMMARCPECGVAVVR